jgi:RHS repeat-associated protein
MRHQSYRLYPRLGKRTGETLTTLFFLTAAALCVPRTMQAQVATYTATLSGVTFADGSTLSGTFSVTPVDNAGSQYISNLNITLSGNPNLGQPAAMTVASYAYMPEQCGVQGRGAPNLVSFTFNNGNSSSVDVALLVLGSTPTVGAPATLAPGVYSIVTSSQESGLQNISLLSCMSSAQSPSAIKAPDNSLLTGGSIIITGTPPKGLGNASNRPGGCHCGDPIDPGTGNVSEAVTDYTTTGPNPLAFTRYYNSMGYLANSATYATSLGPNWRTIYDRYLNMSGGTSGYAERPDGQVINFTQSGGTWTTDSDVDYTLTNSGSTYTLTTPDDTVETYTVTSGKGILSSIKLRDGYTQTLTYTSGQLTSVSDSYSRSFSLTYSSGLLTNVTTPDSSTGITYGYTSGMLTTVTYPTSPSTTLTYLYENSSFPKMLTGITDENSHRYATWAYDTNGRATSSKLGDTLGANLITVAYNSDGTVTVTNAGGVADAYTFSPLQGVPKVTGISRAATSNTAAATESFTYDSNGYLATATDWNGNETQYTNNSHGLPTEIKKAYGSTVEQDTAIAYDTTWVRLPYTITTTGLTTTFAYDTSGNVHTRTETDTTTNSTPYSTNGTTRTWTWTYSSTGQPESVTGPRTDVTQETQWGYTGGVLTSITDALTHVTTINTYTAGGLPTKITDPNGVVTTYTYDGRQRLLSKTVDTSGGNYTTGYTYDSAGNLTRITIPDTTHSDYTYDNAHRLTKITNANGEYISYTLNAFGNRTETDTYNATSTLKRKQTATFDNLGRMLTDVAYKDTSTPLTTTYAYDKNGNATSIQDARSHTTSRSFDALNRLYQVTDRGTGVTTTTYDAHDKVVSVKDPNNHTTSYTRDGFEDVTQQVSPDSGTSVYHYDLADNLTKKVNGASVETDYTYDKLNRELTETFPADTTQNISKTYDQTGGTFGYGQGVGHLTSMTDNVGTMNRQFDERGNIIHHQRADGTTIVDTYAYYDQNNRMWTYVNPDQWTVLIWRDSAGQITGYDYIQQSGPWIWSPSTSFITNVTHLPFGPVSGYQYANGVTRTYTYDLAYRPTNIKDQGTSTILNLTYAYDANGNPTSITDGVNAANSQTLTYDNMDRVLTASAGTGGYGSYVWTYDANGNRASEKLNGGTTVTYNYDTGTNRLHSLTPTSNNYIYSYGSDGNTSQDWYGSWNAENWVYNTRQQLYTPMPDPTGFGQPSSYNYFNGLGQREWKSANIYWQAGYSVDGNTLIEEYNGANQLSDYVYLDGIPVALNGITNYRVSGQTEATYYIHSDRLGTPQAVTNGSQGLEWKDLYQPFGLDVSGYPTSAGNVNQLLRFPGQHYDADTGLNHNGAREYRPDLGRYLQTDPIGLDAGTTNTYAYANDNPFRFVDPNGTDFIIAGGGTLNLYADNGEIRGVYPYSSGMSGSTDYEARGTGPTPPGQYTIFPSEISPTNFFRSHFDFRDWGDYRVPLHPDLPTETYGRSGFFLHGGRLRHGSEGCIKVEGNTQDDLFMKLQQDTVPVTVFVLPPKQQ